MFKKIKSISCLLFLVTLNFLVQAQTERKEISANIKGAYLGSVIYLGFKVGIEQPYKHIEKMEKNGKSIEKDRFLSYNLGFYHHSTFHDNLFVLIERTRRRTAPKGFFVETSPGIGISRTFLSGTTYRVSDAGEVTKQTAAGYTYPMLSLATGVGYDFSKQSENRPYSMYFKPSLLVLFPYNGFVYFRPTAELGVIYKPKNFGNKNVKSIKI